MDPTANILAYAGPSGGQPLDSLFTVLETPDRVTVSKPLPPSYLSAAAAVLAIGCVYAGTVSMLYRVLAVPHHTAAEWATLAVVFTGLSALGTSAQSHLRVARPRTLVMTIDRDGLWVVNGPVTLSGRPWRVRHPRRFRSALGPPDVRHGRLTASLLVRTRFGVDRRLLAHLPPTECRWLATVLNEALARVGRGGT